MKNIAELYEKIGHIRHYTFDSRDVEKGSVFIGIKGENINGNKFAQSALASGALFVIIDDVEYYNKLDDRYIFTENSLDLVSSLATYHRNTLDIPVVGIVGSNGKTTNKDMLNHFLSLRFNVFATKSSFNSQWGLPISILSITKNHDIAVIEMGASHAGDIDYLCGIARPTHGLITNMSESHIGEFGSFEEIKRTKTALYRYLNINKGVIFYNQDDSLITGYAERALNAKLISYRTDLFQEPSGLSFNVVYGQSTHKTNLIGAHNFLNLRAAFTVSLFFGVPVADLLSSLDQLNATNGRSELIVLRNNIDILWDAYNANKQSMITGIDTLCLSDKYKIAILGDMAELGEFSYDHHLAVYNYAKESGVDKIILVGQQFSRVPKDWAVECYPSLTVLKNKLEIIKKQNITVLIKSSLGTGFFNEKNFFIKSID